MAPRKSSQAWTHFTRIDDRPDSAKCNICGNVYKRGGGTKNLLDHLQRFHRELLVGGVMAPGANEPAFYEENNPRKKLLDKYLIRMFATDYQPFCMVEDDGFVQFVKALDPRYKLPSRKTVSKKFIPDLYKRVTEAVKEDLREVKHVALTLDIWTSIRQDPYLAVTVHYVKGEKLKAACLDCVVLPGSHSAENIKNKLSEIINEWQLTNKITAVVTDNCANVVAAVKMLKLRHLSCAAHTLNLVVNDGMKNSPDVDNLLQRCAAIVTFFKKSNLATEKLKSKCSAANKSCLGLVQAVSTRWNSILAMIRLLQLREELIICLSELTNAPQGLDGSDWQILVQLELILRPFEEMTTVLSGENYVTASLIIPLANGLLRALDAIDRSALNFDVLEFLSNIRKSTVDRILNYEQRSVARGATFLNPQFKKLAFVSENRAEEARLQIEAEVKTQLQRTEAPILQPESNTPSPHVGLLSFLNNQNEDSRPRHSRSSVGNAVVDATILVRQYVELQPIDNTRDPIKYWSNADAQLKALAEVASYYTCVPATSVPSERLFSKAGYVISNRRNSLTPAKARMLVVLHGNSAFV